MFISQVNFCLSELAEDDLLQTKYHSVASFCSSARTTASVLKQWSLSRLISCRSRNLAVQLSCMLSKYFRMINFNGSNVSDTFSPQFIAAAHLVSDCSCHTVSAFSTMKSVHRTVESLRFSSL